MLLAFVWALVLLRIGSEFTGRGAAKWHHDFGLLYREQTSFYRRDYPASEVGRAEQPAGGASSDYPPYSFPLAMPWLPPGLGWHAAEVWFILCQALATAIVAAFAWSIGRGETPALRWLLAGSVLAMTGLRADLLFGNYGVLMTAMLVAMMWALERGRWGLAGAAWLASLLKPQMGWLFALLFLQRRGWRVLLAVGMTIVALTLTTCWWTGVTPWEIVQSKYSSRVSVMMLYPERISLVSLLTSAGLETGIAVIACAAAGVVATALVLFTRLRDASLLIRMAFVGLLNRISTYHNACDDLLLVFALAWLGRCAWQSSRRLDWAVFLALAGSVWAPTISLQSAPARVGVVAIWVTAAIYVALRGAREEAATGAALTLKAPATPLGSGAKPQHLPVDSLTASTGQRPVPSQQQS